MWLVAAASPVGLWIEYVKSALNPADPPSRMCPLTDKPIPAEGVNLGVPSLFFSCMVSRDALLKAQFEVPQSDRSFSEPWPCVKPHPP